MAFTLDTSLVHLLHQASQAAEEIFAAGQSKDGPTPRQLAVLAAIAQNEGLSQTDIVEHTGVDRSTLADIVRRLEERGFVARKRTKEDARAYAVKLTKEGQHVLAEATKAALEAEEILATSAGLSAKGRADLVRLLHALANSNRKNVETK